jgi:hypothetical protein
MQRDPLEYRRQTDYNIIDIEVLDRCGSDEMMNPVEDREARAGSEYLQGNDEAPEIDLLAMAERE